jgi:hypothetical protein
MLLAIGTGNWLVFYILCSWLYPRTALDEELMGPMLGLTGLVVAASVIRGITDWCQLRRSRTAPAAPVAVIRGLTGAIIVILLGLLVLFVLMLIGLAGLSVAK